MEKIETNSRYDYKKLFDALIDKEKLCSETVGIDEFDNYILHKSGTGNNSSAYYTWDEYYVLTEDEYREYVDKAIQNKLIRIWDRGRLMKGHSKPVGKIVSFDIVTLHTSGMRHITDYEIVMKDGKAEVSMYAVRYREGKDERVPEEQAVCSEERILKLLNDSRIYSWDGFHGSHPKGVLDGTMFRFEAKVNGCMSIKADGSQNFPKGYRDFTDGLYSILRGE